ncbi:phosphotransferase [Glycomyces sp. MUSA5-2]|uniref:phosphotransferase n=1 Tax=Glycomyces sp. MUSA5-2 TaxID=2053002 RepID=UPI003008CE40
MTLRRDWSDLPAAVRDAVGHQCGGIRAVTPISVGVNSAVACALDTAGDGAVFLKGYQEPARNEWMFRNELAAASAGAPGPQFLWHLEVDRWHLFAWEHLPGRHADLAPGSPDLDLIAAALAELAEIPPLEVGTGFAPEARRWERLQPWKHLAAAPPEHLDPWIRGNLDRFAAAEYDALQILHGNRLVHTDLHGYNILIDDQHRRGHLIDWAWARPAAPWVDAELLAFRLVADGHTSAKADQWRLDHLPHPGVALDIRRSFAVQMLGTWLHLARRDPSRELLSVSAEHALSWAKYLHDME